MAERTVSVALQAQVAGFVAGMRTAGQSVGRFANTMDDRIQRNRQALDNLAGTAGLVGAGMAAAAGVAVVTFARFEKAMSAVQAATGESAANMEELKAAALDAGQRTVYSATEAAGAIEQLAKAGVSTEDILAGGLDGALNLAAAGNVAVADAAETAASAMTQFGLSGQEVPHVADLIAAAAGKAQGGVGDLSQALSQSGLVASQMGVSIEETTGALAAFASAGLLGSDAGTSFKTMLLRLANPTGKAADEMERLGITAYDSQGQFIGLEALAGELKTSLSGLSQEQRNAALATIFGTDAIRAANVLYRQGSTGIEEWTQKVNDQGYAAETAAARMDNLAGDFEQLRGSIETALISLGEGASGPLRDLVQGVEGAVNAFNALPDSAQSATLALVGGGGLALLGVAGMAKLATTISDTRSALSDMGTTGRRVSRVMKFAGVAGAVVGVAGVVDVLNNKLAGLDANINDVTIELRRWEGQGKLSGDAAKLLGDDLGKLESAFSHLADASFGEKLYNAFDTVVPFSGDLDRARSQVEKLDAALKAMATGGHLEAAAVTWQRVVDVAKEQGVTTKELRELFPQYTDALDQAKKANKGAAKGMKQTGDAAATQAEKLSPAEQKLKQMEENARGLDDALQVLEGTLSAVEGEAAYEEAIDTAAARVREFRKQVKKGDTATRGMKNALDNSTEAGRLNQEALIALWKSTGDYATSTKKAGGSQKEVNRILDNGRAQLVDVAAEFFNSRKKAEKYITEVLGIPKNVSTNIKQPGMGKAERNAKQLDNKTRHIPDHKRIEIATNGMLSALENAITLKNEINAIPAYKEVQIHAINTGSGPRPFASGGYVSGPGTSTSDSIPARLSNGEYVVRAAAVTRYGTAMLSAINGMRYASGGYVGMGMAQGGAVSAAGVGGEQVTYNFYPRSVDINERTIGAVIRTARLRERIGRPR